MSVGSRIRTRRKQLKLSVDKVARAIGKDRSTVYRYESDEIDNLSYEIIGQIADVLNVSPAYLMGWEEKEELFIHSEYDFYPVSVAAGLPSNICGVTDKEVVKVSLPDIMMGKYAGSKDVFLMKVEGESLNNVIPSGSIITVKKVDLSELKNDDIVVFSDSNDYSVKRFYNDVDNKRFVFSPDSNDRRFLDLSVDYEEAKNLKIHGKVVLYIVEQE